MKGNYQEQIIDYVIGRRHNGFYFSEMMVIKDCFTITRLLEEKSELYVRVSFGNSPKEELMEKYKEIENLLHKYNIKYV